MAPQITLDTIKRFPKNGPTDPIRYYAQPVTGWLFRERVNLGLRLLGDRRYGRVLEVGYGSGAVLTALAQVADSLEGVDLDADPTVAQRTLDVFSVRADLRQGNAYALPYDDARFDLVASFSTFEHLHEYERALREVRRVMAPRGHFLLGMPAVNLFMEAGFHAIGFKGINDHHVTTPQQVAASFSACGFRVVREARLTLPAPGFPGFPVYFDWLLEGV